MCELQGVKLSGERTGVSGCNLRFNLSAGREARSKLQHRCPQLEMWILTLTLTRDEHMLGAVSHAHHYLSFVSTLKKIYKKVSIAVFILIYITHMSQYSTFPNIKITYFHNAVFDYNALHIFYCSRMLPYFSYFVECGLSFYFIHKRAKVTPF